MGIITKGFGSSNIITKGYASGSSSSTTEESTGGGRRRRQRVLYVGPEKVEKAKKPSMMDKYAKVLAGEKLSVTIDIAPDVVMKLMQKFLKTEIEKLLTKGE